MNIQSARTSARAGFTLIEILVALLIIGILAGVAVPGVLKYVATARENTTKSNLRTIDQAIDMYKLDVGSLPKKLEDLVVEPTGTAAKKWKGSYFKKPQVPMDGWGNEFMYKLTSQGRHPYELYSYGPNGLEGAEEERISVWDL